MKQVFSATFFAVVCKSSYGQDSHYWKILCGTQAPLPGGAVIWVDPDAELSYVFLSNRVYPTRNNSKLYDLSIRSNIMQAAYDAIID